MTKIEEVFKDILNINPPKPIFIRTYYWNEGFHNWNPSYDMNKEYDLLIMDDKNLAIDALNRLLTAPLPPNFGDSDGEESDGGSAGGTTGGGSTTGFGGGGDEEGDDDDAGMEPDEDEPADTEPESDMI